MVRFSFAILLVGWLLSPASVPVAAQSAPVAEARERVARGEALFERGDYDAALVEFEAAYERIGEHPSRYLILYNIGQCHERRFRYDVALRYYRRYLDEGGRDDEGSAGVEENIAALEGLLAHVTISTRAPHAEAFVDGRLAGEAPGEIRVPAGMHTISVRAEGYVPAEQAIEVPAAGRLELRLEPTLIAERYRGISPAFALSAAGLAIASLAIGVGFGMSALDARAGIDERLRDGVDRWSVTSDDVAHVHDLAVTADVLYGATAVFALTGVVLGVVADWSFGVEDAPSASAHLSLGPGSLSLAGSF